MILCVSSILTEDMIDFKRGSVNVEIEEREKTGINLLHMIDIDKIFCSFFLFLSEIFQKIPLI